MTDEARQDERMIEWLKDGPWDPPIEALEAAVAHARSHPHRAHRVGGLRRSLMSGIHLTPVQQRPAGHRTAFAVLATVAAIVVVAAGLVGGMNLINGPSAPVGPGATSQPSAEPSPAPTAEPLPADVSGLMSDCRETSAGSSSEADAVIQTRGRILACVISSSDARVAGNAVLVYNADEPTRGDIETWGSISVESAGGTWSGVWLGKVQWWGMARRHLLMGVLTGSDDHDGLRVRWTLDNEEGDSVSGGSDLAGTVLRLEATVETVDTIPPNGTRLISGAAGCSAVESGTETDVDGVTQIRGAVIECSSSGGSDPRLEGITHTVANIDLRADESADMSGTEEITVDGELRWRGEASGTIAVGYTTHHLEGVDIGYGPYAGLEYHWTTIGDPETGYVTSGRIESASND